MVRAGVINHPIKWAHSGYREIQKPPEREMDSPAGPLATLLPPVTMPDYEARISAVPGLGKRTERILGELGYSRGNICHATGSGVV
jgi:hypothetical protein